MKPFTYSYMILSDYCMDQAMPDLPVAAREHLLFHHFLTGLPVDISKQLCLMGDTKYLGTSVTVDNTQELA